MSNNDALFISGEFFDYKIPKDKRYLMKYFSTGIQENFISYILVFGNYDNFVDHTGIFCKKRYMQFMYSRFKLIEESHYKAKKEMNLEFLSEIESGKFSLNSFPEA